MSDQTNEQTSDSTNTQQSVPYERFKEVNEKYKTLEAQLSKLESERKAQQEKEMQEQAQWKTLAEQAKAELAAERAARLRLKIAAEKGLPAEVAERLMGSTEEEITADAEKLLPLFAAKRGGPGAPPPPDRGNPQRLDVSAMTPEEIRKNAGKILAQTRGQ